MHHTPTATFRSISVPSHPSWPLACYCLGLLLAVAMLLATSMARAEVIAEGDFTPDYNNSDPMDPLAMPLYGNDPDGIQSPVQMDVPVIIGVTGIGKLTIDVPSFTFPLVSAGGNQSGGGILTTPSIIGQDSTALGEALVTGFGSEWKILGTLVVAEEGLGFLNLTGGARVTAEDDTANPLPSIQKPEIVVGNLPGSEGFVTIDGFGSRLDSTLLTIANEGNAEVIVSGRGSILTQGEAFIGVEKDTVAKVTLTGLGTRWLVTESNNLFGTTLKGNLTIGSEETDGVGHSSLAINDEALVQIDGATTVNPHGRIELGGGTLRTLETNNITDSGFVTNNGVILGDGWIEGGLVNEDGGELRNAAAIANLRQQLLITGMVENGIGGLIDSIGGEMEFLAEVTNDGNIVARDALMRFRDGLINDNQLVLGGDTTVYGDITNNGDIHTLAGSEAAIIGDLTFSASSVVGLVAGTAQGTLDIVGAADLADSLLQLDYSAGVSAQPGDSYQVLSATEGFGGTAFANTTAIADGLIWNILVGANDITVTAAGAVGAPVGSDFNGDGIVDRQDLAIWENNFPIPSGATGEMGDADGDGDVDAADFLIWQMKNGGPPAIAAVATVPEPATGWLLAFSGLLLMGTTYRPRPLCPVGVRG